MYRFFWDSVYIEVTWTDLLQHINHRDTIAKDYI